VAKIAGLLAVIVVMFHDGISLGLAQVNADSDAQVAARAGAQAWHQTQDVQRSYDLAALAVEENGTTVDRTTFLVDQESGLVTVETSRQADTMAAKYFGWLDDLVAPTSQASARVVQR
jgi:hypothetical protein